MTYYTIQELASLLKVSPNTVEGWYRFRGLPAVKVGRTVRIRDVDLHDWLAHAIVTCGGGQTGDTQVQHRIGLDSMTSSNQDTGMNTTTLSRDIKASGLYPAQCWSCGVGVPAVQLSEGSDLGLCADCATIDGDAIPDMDDPNWKGNTKPLEAIFVAPPNVKRVR